MPNYRINRVNEEITREAAQIVRDIKDPRVAGAFISITGADCSPDFKQCKIYYSIMGDEGGETAKGLRSAAPFVRSELAKRINLRETPAIRFVADDSLARGDRISQILKEISAEGSGSPPVADMRSESPDRDRSRETPSD